MDTKYLEHVTIISRMFITIACCLVVWLWSELGLGKNLVSSRLMVLNRESEATVDERVFIILSVVVVALPLVITMRMTISFVVSGSTIQNDALYANTADQQNANSATTQHRNQPPKTPSKPGVVDLILDDADGYCIPSTILAKTFERGQGVGAEEARNHYSGALSSGGNGPSPVTTPGGVIFRCLEDIPDDISGLTVEEILQCLRWLNMSEYVETVRSKQVDGDLLMSVNQQILVEELGFKRLDAIKLDKFARDRWRPKLVRASPISTGCNYYNQPQRPQNQQQMQQQQRQPFLDLQYEPLYTDV